MEHAERRRARFKWFNRLTASHASVCCIPGCSTSCISRPTLDMYDLDSIHAVLITARPFTDCKFAVSSAYMLCIRGNAVYSAYHPKPVLRIARMNMARTRPHMQLNSAQAEGHHDVTSHMFFELALGNCSWIENSSSSLAHVSTHQSLRSLSLFERLQSLPKTPVPHGNMRHLACIIAVTQVGEEQRFTQSCQQQQGCSDGHDLA